MSQRRDLLQRVDRLVGVIAQSDLPSEHALRREADAIGAAITNELLVSSGAVDVVGPLRFVTAADFAAVDEPASVPLAGDSEAGAVIPSDGLVLVYGDGGAGKTTLVLDLLVHLASGEAWLELVHPARPLQVGLVENEGPRAMFRGKLRGKLAAWPQAGERIIVLEEPWQGVTFRDDEQRDELVRLVDEHELDLLVAAPLSRLGMIGGGTLDEIGDFAALVADVQRRCERPLTVLLVHHTNRAGQVSGAWEGIPDTLLHVQGQGHGRTRLHWQKLRWSPSLHATSTHLVWAEGETFVVEEREEITEGDLAEMILTAVREQPGEAWTNVRKEVRGRSSEDRDATRDRLIRDGLIVNVPKRKGGWNLWAADDPALNRPDAGTEPERLSFPSPERGAADASVLPSHRPIGTVGTERNGDPGACLSCGKACDSDELRCAACTASAGAVA